MTVLNTERLVLRPWSRGDLDELSVIFADPRVWWFPFRRAFRRDETEDFLMRQLVEWKQQGWGLWAVACDDRLIGYVGFALPTFLPEVMPVPEIGWRLHPSYWGQGLASEAGRAVLAYGFGHLRFKEVVSIYEPQNLASGRVMERLGMVVDRDTVHPGLGIPIRIYRLTSDVWRAAAPLHDKSR